MHSNSDEYKNLGTLHKDKRTVEYFPQDERMEFSTRPQIMGREKGGVPPGYNFQEGGLSYQQRVPDNLVGENLRSGRMVTDQENQ